MIVIPAIDISGGAAVTWNGAAPRTRTDALGAAREIARLGFSRMHLVDLDAAAGRGKNDRLARDVVRATPLDVQFGGGIDDPDHVQDALDLGARWAVVAARAMAHVDDIADLAAAFPLEIILSIPLRGRRVDADRWPRSLPSDVLELLAELDGLPLAALLLRAVDREGQLSGPDLHLVEDAVDASEIAIQVAGGVASVNQLRDLDDRGASAAIVGTALHAGALHPALLVAEFSS